MSQDDDHENYRRTLDLGETRKQANLRRIREAKEALKKGKEGNDAVER